jgi:hypothetical protein
VAYVYEPNPAVRRALEQLERQIDSLPKLYDPDQLRRGTETLHRGQAVKIQRAVEATMRTLPRADLQRLSEIAAQNFSRRDVLEQLGQLARAQQFGGLARHVDTAELAAAATQLGREVEAAGDRPEEGPRRSFGWWLASRPLTVQVALLNRGLAVLAALTDLGAHAAGEDLPDGLRLSVATCLVMVEFLLLWLKELDKPE